MSDFDRIQQGIGEWGAATFPKRNPRGIVLHLRAEVSELEMDPACAEEAADCAILLLHLASVQGYSLREAVERKMKINQEREWLPPDADGVSYHRK